MVTNEPEAPCDDGGVGFSGWFSNRRYTCLGSQGAGGRYQVGLKLLLPQYSCSCLHIPGSLTVFRSPKTQHNCFLRTLSLNTLNHFITLLLCCFYKIGVVCSPCFSSCLITQRCFCGFHLAHLCCGVGRGLGGLNWILLDRLSIGGRKQREQRGPFNSISTGWMYLRIQETWLLVSEVCLDPGKQFQLSRVSAQETWTSSSRVQVCLKAQKRCLSMRAGSNITRCEKGKC